MQLSTDNYLTTNMKGYRNMVDLDLDEIIKCLSQVAKILHERPEHALKELRNISSLVDKQVPYQDGHMQRVCEYSLKIGEELGLTDKEMVILEHEHYDGSGYPNALAGSKIPPMGRIIAVADAYDAMTSERPYRNAKIKEQAIKELKRCSGTQFDPEVVDIFVKILM